MKKYTCEIYRDKKKDFRWRLTAKNGRKIADSGEGYKREGTMMRILDNIFRGSNVEFKSV